MWTRGGEDITEIVIGTGTAGIMNGFLTGDSSKTGRTGIIIDIGKGKEPGVCRAIDLGRNSSEGNSDVKGGRNINRGRRYNDISNKDKSYRENLRFRNLRGSSERDKRDKSKFLRFRNGDMNLRIGLSCRKDRNKDLRFSNLRGSSNRDKSIPNLGLGASNTNGNQKGIQNIEIRRAGSFFQSALSVNIAGKVSPVKF